MASAGEGRGARFTVRLPVPAVRRGAAPPPALAAAEPAGGAADRAALAPDVLASLAGVRVLVVDDEPDSRDMLAFFLRGCGAEVRTAASAAAARAALAAERPDVVVSDIGMPGEDGYELVRRLRALPPEEGGEVPAIALTAHARGDDRIRALGAGFQAHLAKPVDPTELALVAARLLERRGGATPERPPPERPREPAGA